MALATIETPFGIRVYPSVASFHRKHQLTAHIDSAHKDFDSHTHFLAMVAHYTYRAILLALLLCLLCTAAVAVENGQDTLVVQVSEHLTCNSHRRTNVSYGVITAQESEIHECASIEKLSALKIAIEEKESPVMRQVFAWLFPFGPGWNAGKCFKISLMERFFNVAFV